MQAGFALVEAGLTRAKNVVNIFAKNMADAIVGITAWFACGWAFAFGGAGKLIGEPSQFFLSDQDLRHPGRRRTEHRDARSSSRRCSPRRRSRSPRERWRNGRSSASYLIFSVVMCAFIYPVVVHWTWGGGLIAQMQHR